MCVTVGSVGASGDASGSWPSRGRWCRGAPCMPKGVGVETPTALLRLRKRFRGE